VELSANPFGLVVFNPTLCWCVCPKLADEQQIRSNERRTTLVRRCIAASIDPLGARIAMSFEPGDRHRL
jgi:hypothetical protein